MNDNEKRLVDISTITGVSNWLTVLPIKEVGFELSRHQFWGSIRFDMVGKSVIYQHLLFAVVNLIFSTVWVARKVALYTYSIVIYDT